MSKIEVYHIKSDDPIEIRKDLIDNFPKFRDICLANGATFQLCFSNIAGARFERDWGTTIREFVFTTYFTAEDPDKKYKRRKLKISQSSDR